MSRLSRFLRIMAVLVLSGGLACVVAAGAVYWYVAPKLPSIEVLKEVQLQTPLRVYTRDGRLIAEFGEKRRAPLTLAHIPDRMVKAVLAAEDERFYDHPGVDWQGLVRAVVHLVRTGEKGPGGSTITMQVARNFFLGREKTYVRKLNEILLALKIERELSKGEILELYFNKIFLGHRAYGVGAAAQVYYGKPLEELDVAQIAMIAGLPKAPSRFNPIVNPDRALARRNYVLGRMRDLGFIDDAEYETAVAAEVTARLHGLQVEVEAPYLAEMVRSDMEERHGDTAYTAGYRVYTTADSRRQEAANQALRKALIEYDERHGYRGPELHADPAGPDFDVQRVLADVPVVGGLRPAVVTTVDEGIVTAHVKDVGRVDIPWSGIEWARPYVSENRLGPKPKSAEDVVTPGDVIRARLTEEGWRLAQIPAVEGAIVSLDPNDGAVQALAGGFDFYRSKFNRVTQALRQPGSSFKPFIYSSALEKGFTPASFINDAPVVFDDPGLEDAWRPENYSGKFFGPTRLREALYKSRNLVSIRVLRAIGIEFALEHIRRFGFDVERLPPNLSLALGSGAVTPMELATGYAVLANGGYRIEPYFIDRVEDALGNPIEHSRPRRVCRECDDVWLAGFGAPAAVDVAAAAITPGAPAGGSSDVVPVALAPAAAPEPPPALALRTVDPRNIWLMNSMMRDVIRRGTGRRARQLGRKDLAGKTGTTNEQRDAWFSGFMPDLVTTAWVGFDQHQPLGRRETGARAALPMWIEYMRQALEGVDEKILEQPEGLVTVRIDPATGNLAGASDENAIFETFRTENAPSRQNSSGTGIAAGGEESGTGVREKLF